MAELLKFCRSAASSAADSKTLDYNRVASAVAAQAQLEFLRGNARALEVTTNLPSCSLSVHLPTELVPVRKPYGEVAEQLAKQRATLTPASAPQAESLPDDSVAGPGGVGPFDLVPLAKHTASAAAAAAAAAGRRSPEPDSPQQTEATAKRRPAAKSGGGASGHSSKAAKSGDSEPSGPPPLAKAKAVPQQRKPGSQPPPLVNAKPVPQQQKPGSQPPPLVKPEAPSAASAGGAQKPPPLVSAAVPSLPPWQPPSHLVANK